MKKVIFLVLGLLLVCVANAQIQNPVKWSFSCGEADSKGNMTIYFKANIEQGWHIYGMNMPEDGPIPTSFNFTKSNNAILSSKISTDKKESCEMDAMFALELCKYKGEVTFSKRVETKPEKNSDIEGYVEFMACNNTNCLSPTKVEFSFHKEGVKTAKEEPKAQTDNKNVTNVQTSEAKPAVVPFEFPALQANEDTDTWKPVIDQFGEASEVESSKSGSLWLIFCLGLLGGILAIITPCVWPIIPMTVSFFLKKDNDPSKGKAYALLYGCSIIVIYVGLGILITLLFGANALNALSTSAIFNLFLFALLVFFAISFFGGFELTLPASWSTKIDEKSEQTAGIISILFMALTLVVVSFSCTGPIVGTLLVEVATGGDIMAPIIGMLGFAIALAVPFTIFAFFPNMLKKLPKSGNWLNTTKVLLGFFELAFSLKFLSVADMAYGWGILNRETFLVIWIVIFLFAGLYILGYLRFKDEPALEGVSICRLFGGGATIAFAIYLIPGLWGAPLKCVSAFAPPIWTQEFNLQEESKAQFNDYDEAIAHAQRTGKPVLIDFTGYGCVNCRKMEAAVWNAPEVKDLIDNEFILVSLFVDDKHELPEPITFQNGENTKTVTTVGEKWSYLEEHKFGANSMPFYVIVDAKGNALNKPYGYSENVDAFVEFLKTGLKNKK